MKKRSKLITMLVVASMLVMMFGMVVQAAANTNSTSGSYNGYAASLSCVSNRPEASATFTYGRAVLVAVDGKANYVDASQGNSVRQAPVSGYGYSGSASGSYARENVYDYISSITQVKGMVGTDYTLGPIAAYSGLTK